MLLEVLVAGGNIPNVYLFQRFCIASRAFAACATASGTLKRSHPFGAFASVRGLLSCRPCCPAVLLPCCLPAAAALPLRHPAALLPCCLAASDTLLPLQTCCPAAFLLLPCSPCCPCCPADLLPGCLPATAALLPCCPVALPPCHACCWCCLLLLLSS